MGTEITLKVAEASQQDVGLGRVRIDTGSRKKLGLEVGDIVEIEGKQVTAAKIFRVMSEDEVPGAWGLLLLDEDAGLLTQIRSATWHEVPDRHRLELLQRIAAKASPWMREP